MKILNEINDSPIKHVTLFLTPDEAKSLIKQIGDLLAKPKLHHVHIEDEDFEREITVVVYTPSNISTFDERSRKLIEKDE